MKAAYFILPLFAALTSARAVDHVARSEHSVSQCADLLATCLTEVSSSGQSNPECAEYEKQCGDQSLRQSPVKARDAPAPPSQPPKGGDPQKPPKVPEFGVFAASIKGVVDAHAGGKVDAHDLAKQLHDALSKGNCSLTVAIQIIIKACGNGGAGINLAALINAILKCVCDLFGVFDGILVHGAASIGGIAQIICKVLGGVAHVGLDIAGFIVKISGMFAHGRFDLGELLNAVITTLNDAGVHPRHIGEVSNELMLLSERSSIAARDEMVHARSLLDIPKLIAAIVQCFPKGQKPDWGKAFGLILQVVKELAVGIGKFFIPGLGAIAGRDEDEIRVAARGIAIGRGLKLGQGADWPKFAEQVIDLIMNFSIGKLIKVVIAFFTNLFKPKKA
ncbi:TPA_exp: Uncharacterized protein A8136_5310 [Trichophyton benhamiae CBS 112371]|uniref:Uncharacterized protein n=1 Tax=Arthroderma benhamiae (strain ATCC MYA-4681 / CBS 112371) TaxID=663331 RepID=D4B4V6_ARTBC|nr:uncharacterized protein ARB_03496 [Trichophyton benhamiae CBS 112371]EFE29601.1 hypothetical protein ARB_03496 [Trichophyton benhamiae CBS 112371]DAA72866.1 TPA_exp: Uncharacterized protein A8136_5310 [Trichophyton benhamiae CBS 112371]